MKKIYSIIIPTFNCSELLEKTLESIICQEKDLYECIIVDGSSTDNTLKIIRKYKNMYLDNIKYISEPDKGIYDAMNKGVDLAQGEYLYFIGAGDLLFEDCLSSLKKHLNYTLEIVYGNVCFSDNNVICGRKYNKKNLSILLMSHQSVFYKKQVFNLVGKYNLKYRVIADNDLNIRIFGEDRIKKQYCNINIARYLEGGFSENNKDPIFFRDYKEIINNNLGGRYYSEYYIKSGKRFYDFLRFADYKTALIIGDKMAIDQVDEEISGKACILVDKYEIYNLGLEYIIDNLIQIDFSKYDIIIINFSKERNSYKVFEYLDSKFKNVNDIAVFNSFVKSDEFIDFIGRTEKCNMIIFGASNLAKKVFEYLEDNFHEFNVKCFLDNNKNLDGEVFCGLTVYNPNNIKVDSETYILIASTWQNDIYQQLLDKGVEENKIIRCI